jgi:hypothetical protein
VAKPNNNSNRADVIIQYPLDREFKEVYQMQLVVIDEDGASGLCSNLMLCFYAVADLALLVRGV